MATMSYDPALGGLIYQVASTARREGGISFAGGYPDPALFDVAGLADAFAAVFRDSARVALQYGERDGCLPLRERLAAFSSSPARTVSPDEVIVVNGGQQGLALAVQACLRPGDTVLVDSPAFPTALQLFHLAGLNCVTIESDADGLLPGSLAEQARRHGAKMLYLVPSYSNPGGTLLSSARRLEVLRLAVELGFDILADDPYRSLWFGAPPPPTLLALSAQVPGSRERLIEVSSLSKVVAPGLRVGWMIPPAAWRQRLLFAKQSSDIHSALHTQHALAAYWASGRLDAHLPEIRAAYAARAAALDAALATELGDRVAYAKPRGGMFVWVRVPEVADTRALLDAAQREKVFFVPGVAFYPADPDTSTVRLSFATTPAEAMAEGVRRLRRVFDAAHAG